MIWRFGPLIRKNLWRNKRRSLLTALGVAVAVFVYVALHAAVEGMRFPLRQVGDSQLLYAREDGRSNALASRLPQSYVTRVGDIEGVAAATGVLDTLTVLPDSGVHIFTRGVDPEGYAAVQPLETEGASLAALREPGQALVGHRLMAQLGWSPGDDVEISELGLRAHVAGTIVEQDVDLGGHLLVRLGTLQALRGAEGEVSYVIVAATEGTDPDVLGARIDEALRTTPVPTATASAQSYAQAIISDFRAFLLAMSAFGWAAVVIVVLGAANTMAMNVRERTREIGALKAIGFTPALVLQVVLAEAICLSIGGGLLGLAGAWLAVGNEGAAMSGIVLQPGTIWVAAALSLLIGLLGGLLPALSAARLDTVVAMRTIG